MGRLTPIELLCRSRRRGNVTKSRHRALAETTPPSDVPGIPPEARPIFRSLFTSPLVPVNDLRAAVAGHLAFIRKEAERFEFVDVSLAEAIATAANELIDGLTPETTETERRLVQAAVCYFVLESDVESDVGSITGFDDDVAVLNAVLQRLGRPNLRIKAP